MIRPIC